MARNYERDMRRAEVAMGGGFFRNKLASESSEHNIGRGGLGEYIWQCPGCLYPLREHDTACPCGRITPASAATTRIRNT